MNLRDMDLYFEEFDRAIEAMKDEDPDQYEAISRGVAQGLEEFGAARDRNKMEQLRRDHIEDRLNANGLGTRFEQTMIR